MFCDESSPAPAHARRTGGAAAHARAPASPQRASEYVNANNFRQQYLNRGYPCGKKVTLVFLSSKLWNEIKRPALVKQICTYTP